MQCDCNRDIDNLRYDLEREVRDLGAEIQDLRTKLRGNTEDTLIADRILSDDIKQVRVRVNTHDHLPDPEAP